MDRMADLLRRVEDLEAQMQVKACINRYMHLCDLLGEGSDLDALMDLFTADAVWEGVGSRYAKTFGRLEGRDAIRAMFAKYTLPPSHFRLNVHYLTGDEVAAQGVGNGGAEATGRWLMLQVSTFADGRSRLSSARLNVRFRREGETWRMAHFQTERLYSRPVSQPWDEDSDLPVPE